MANYTYVVVVGGREFTDYALFDRELSRVLRTIKGDVRLVSGGARGADKMAETYARKHRLGIRVINADWNRYGKEAGKIRNAAMLDHAQKCGRAVAVAFWDYQSRGTGDTVRKCKERNIPITIVDIGIDYGLGRKPATHKYDEDYEIVITGRETRDASRVKDNFGLDSNRKVDCTRKLDADDKLAQELYMAKKMANDALREWEASRRKNK